LARLTEIVPFAPISEENVVRIFDIHLKSLTDPLHKQGVSMAISPEAKNFSLFPDLHRNTVLDK